MKKITLEAVGETVYYETMPNGLTVYILPKEGYSKTYASYTTDYGSIDRTFIPLGADEKIVVPDGIAHFLEHKMFEKEEGDIFQTFSEQGASANAFTSFTRTAYLFSATREVEKNLETLLNFVQEPYFTEETVEKEKGIIAQEILMYDDDPDWRLYFGAIENMYEQHPVRIDIAGTVDSIQDITAEHLYTCYETFYHPSNMMLLVVGNIDPEETMALVRDNQRARQMEPAHEVERFLEEEPCVVATKEQVIQMDVFKPKVNIAFKMPAGRKRGRDYLKQELATSLGLDLLFGTTTAFYDEAYDEGLIDESFNYSYTNEATFAFASISSDTFEPKELYARVRQQLNDQMDTLDENDFKLLIRRKIGQFIRALNSPEFIANQFTHYAMNGVDLFEHIDVYESLTLDDVKEAVRPMVNEEAQTVMIIELLANEGESE